MEQLCQKKLFCDINNRMRRCFPEHFKILPISFLVPEEVKEVQAYMELHPNFHFIGKPNRGKGGEGIILIEKFTDIPKNYVSNSQKEMLVQRYVKTPLLLDK
jgi:glutathione synthase/RimK-type ligase-like ATP-grasp enzyme